MLGIGGIAIFVGYAFLIWSGVLWLMFLYRAWKIIEPGSARTTPGQAVGMLFIPFYNLYWIFQAYHGWSQDYNRSAARGRSGIHAKEGLFQTFAILTLCSAVPYVGLLAALPLIVIGPMIMHNTCQIINWHAHSPEG